MLIASNLGQMLGRLMYGDDTAVRVKPEAKPAPRVDRRGQVLELVRQRGSVSCGELVAALGITSGNASVVLYNMHDEGRLARSGERGVYRYSLPDSAR